jgi:hypothetical protein
VLRRTGLTYTRTQIGSEDILASAVTSTAIADGAVTAAKIANGAVTSAKLSANADSTTTLSVAAGAYGTSTIIPTITVAANGRVTSVSNNTVVTDQTPQILMLAGM